MIEFTQIIIKKNSDTVYMINDKNYDFLIYNFRPVLKN